MFATISDLKIIRKQISDTQSKNGFGSLGEIMGTHIPRNPFGLPSIGNIELRSRDTKFIEQYTMMRDPFTVSIVQVIIARAMGLSHDSNRAFAVKLKDGLRIRDNIREQINDELEHIYKVISPTLMEVVTDSQFFGDGYARIFSEEGKGVEKIIVDVSLKPYNVIPYIDNMQNNRAYEVGYNNKIYNNKNVESTQTSDGRPLFSPEDIGRVCAPPNGIREIDSESIIIAEKIGAFKDQKSVFPDMVFGGVMECCYESFQGYLYGIQALSNARVSSQVLERFLIHELKDTKPEERRIIRNSLEKSITDTNDKIKQKISAKDSAFTRHTHYIPSINGANTVSIQESDPNYSNLSSVEDIMIYIKRYMADIGYNFDLTAYSQSSQGGNEEGGVVKSSLQMEVYGSLIREAVTPYIRHIVSIHFKKKFGLDINDNLIDVVFPATINASKINEENNRLTAISNSQQVIEIVNTLRMQQHPDTPENRDAIRAQLSEIITENPQKEQILDTYVSLIFTKQPQTEE